MDDDSAVYKKNGMDIIKDVKSVFNNDIVKKKNRN